MVKYLSFLVIGIFIIPLFFITDAVADSRTGLVGVIPFSNQRSSSQNDWVGYYIRARIENNLRRNSHWTFQNLRTLHFWKDSPSIFPSARYSKSILVVGTHQRVIDIGVIHITVQKISETSLEETRFKFTYKESELSDKIDLASRRIGTWIDPEYSQDVIEKETLEEDELKEFYELMTQLYEPDQFPEARLVLHLMDRINERSSVEQVIGVVESALVLSLHLNQKERESLFKQVELILKRALKADGTVSDLYALLAETYFLNQSYAAWIEKTATDALKFNNQNELAMILKLLVSAPDAESISGDLDRLNRINPHFWTEIKKRPSIYQKGLLAGDLRNLGKRLNQF